MRNQRSFLTCAIILALSAGSLRAQGGILDSLIAKFDGGTLFCQDAVDSFRAYYDHHNKNAFAALYLGEAYLAAGDLRRACVDSSQDSAPVLDSAKYYFRIAHRLDPTVRDRRGNRTSSLAIGLTLLSKALWNIYHRDTIALFRDLQQSRSLGAYLEPYASVERATLNLLPDSAIYFARGDYELFLMLYEQIVLGVRRDVSVIGYDLLEQPWYEHVLDDGLGSVIAPIHFAQVPGTSASSRSFPPDEEQVVELAGYSEVPQTFAVDSTVHDDLERELGHPLSNSPKTGDLAASEGNAIHADMFQRILRANKWRRPVYLSRLLGAGYFTHIGPHLRCEGFGYRVFPDSGTGYIPYTFSEFTGKHSLWIDTTRYRRAIDSALALVPRSDSLVRELLSAYFLDQSFTAYLCRLMQFVPLEKAGNLDTATMFQVARRMLPLFRSNSANVGSEFAMLVATYAMVGNHGFQDDAKWMRGVLEPMVHQPGLDTVMSKEHILYAYDLWALHDCDALEKFVKWLKKPAETDEAEQKMFDFIPQLLELCRHPEHGEEPGKKGAALPFRSRM